MKKLIIVTMIAACVALCAAVWPHGNTVETPVPAAETAVSAKEATVAEIEKPAALAEKEKRTSPRQESPQEEQPEPEIGGLLKYPQLPNSSLPRGRHLLKIPCQSRLRPRHPKNCSPAIKFMWRALAGWSTRGPIIVKTARIFTKTATKLGSWGEMCSYPLHSLPIHVIMIALNCWTVLNFDRS